MPITFDSKLAEDECESELVFSADSALLEEKNGGRSYKFPRMEMKRPISVRLWLLHGGALVLYTGLFCVALWTSKDKGSYRHTNLVASSANSAIEYGTRIFDGIDDFDRFFGAPSPELDARWEGLLKYQWLQLPASDMENLGRLDEGIMLPDGGYFGTLGVFHDLHCLRRVHHVLYRDHYFPDLTDEQRHLDDRHAAHCLNSLRQSIQCAGDVSLLTMKWVPYNREPTANFTGPHQCVNWDGIQDWAHDRVYDVMAPNVLVHPVLGPSYPDGGHSFGVARVGKVGTDSKLTT